MKVKLNQTQLKKIIKESVKNILGHYHLTDVDELMEYMWLRPRYTGLNVDLFVDDGGSYVRHKHIPLLFARNGYNKDCQKFIPFALSKNPIILDTRIDYAITYNEIFAIQDFIITNLSSLLQLANSKLSHSDFVHSIHVPSYVITEQKMILTEMATLRMSDSNLPMDVWLDEGATYQGHAPRLKFRASNEQRTTHEFSSMLLTNPPTIENMPDNSPLKKKDLEKLKDFVINNLEQLLKLSRGEIDYATEFLPNMVK